MTRVVIVRGCADISFFIFAPVIYAPGSIKVNSGEYS
jgi:hypothetical protein